METQGHMQIDKVDTFLGGKMLFPSKFSVDSLGNYVSTFKPYLLRRVLFEDNILNILIL